MMSGLLVKSKISGQGYSAEIAATLSAPAAIISGARSGVIPPIATNEEYYCN